MRSTVTAFAILLAACSNEGGKTPESGAARPPDPATDAVAPITPAIAAPSLEVIWLAEGFNAPEGVAQALDGAYLISNVSGEETDGDGFISRLGADGTVLAARFIDHLDGPKGMAVDAGVLYVTDIDQVRSFDATSGVAGATVAIPDAKFLNDATVRQGDIFVSDSGTGRIWRLSDEGHILWREGEELSGVNGLLGDGDRLLISTMTSGSLFEATEDGGWRTIAAGMSDADGVGIVPDRAGGGYLVSSWPGEIYHAREDGAVTTMLNTRAAGILQNDLTIFGDVVIVPNWEPGTVTAWRIAAD